MLNNLMKYINNGLDINPIYNASWEKIKELDLLWFHNIATTAYKKNLFFLKTYPVKKWAARKERPIMIGGVRGEVGFSRSKQILKFFDAIHTSNNSLRDKARKYNDFVYTFYPGIDTELFKPDLSKRPDRCVIGWVGDRSKKMKNTNIIQMLDYPYKMATKDNYIPHSEAPSFYNSLAVYTHFSSHEGCNRTILEAAACGLPVIATDVGAADQLIEKEWLIPYTNNHHRLALQFKKRLNKLRKNPNLLKSVGIKNRKSSLRFDWSQVAKRWKEIILKTIRRTS